jgi:sialidase-1
MRRLLILCTFLLVCASQPVVVDVFSKGEGGYSCIKIPYILATPRGALIAWGEARFANCSDYTGTDLVTKRSEDGGLTWSPLSVFFGNSSAKEFNVIGNAAPVVTLKNKIVVPFNRNNHDVLVMESVDDGLTWSGPVNVTTQTNLPQWGWVGLGPPAGLVLRHGAYAGRIVVPAYHDLSHDFDGEVSHGHLIISDDEGATWRLGGVMTGLSATNECQAVELTDGTIVVNSRGFLTHRFVTNSTDGGETFGPTVETNLPEPLTGCEGSMIRPEPGSDVLLYSGLNDADILSLRYNLTLFTSKDAGLSWQPQFLIDDGPSSAYSAMVIMPNSSIGILYERSQTLQVIFVPDHISFKIIEPR